MISIKEKLDFGALIKKYAVASIIIALIGMVIGVLFIIAPLALTSFTIWLALTLIALAGLVAVIRFIYPGKGKERDGFAFAFGLIIIAIFVILLVCACLTKPGTYEWQGKTYNASGFVVFTAGLVRFFSIFFGVVACFGAVWSLCMIGSVEKGKKGIVIFGDILSLVLGILMIIFPFAYSFVAGIIVGVYLIIIAIFALVVAIKALVAVKKAKKEIKDKVVDADNK